MDLPVLAGVTASKRPNFRPRPLTPPGLVVLPTTDKQEFEDPPSSQFYRKMYSLSTHHYADGVKCLSPQNTFGVSNSILQSATCHWGYGLIQTIYLSGTCWKVSPHNSSLSGAFFKKIPNNLPVNFAIVMKLMFSLCSTFLNGILVIHNSALSLSLFLGLAFRTILVLITMAGGVETECLSGL